MYFKCLQESLQCNGVWHNSNINDGRHWRKLKRMYTINFTVWTVLKYVKCSETLCIWDVRKTYLFSSTNQISKLSLLETCHPLTMFHHQFPLWLLRIALYIWMSVLVLFVAVKSLTVVCFLYINLWFVFMTGTYVLSLPVSDTISYFLGWIERWCFWLPVWYISWCYY